MTGLLPFWSFYGGKWRIAPRYPQPRYRTIVEPFAGAAGYSSRYSDRDVILVDRDPLIAALWRYLIHVSSAEVLSLPLAVEDTRSLNVAEEARWLIGFWLNKGTERPRRSPSKWMRMGLRPKSVWGPEIRARIAAQVEAIRHWRIIEGNYYEVAVREATWFVDPPYNNAAGARYRFGADALDFSALASWVGNLRGQVMVCENVGATWLPFEPFTPFYGARGSKRPERRAEALYHVEAA